MRRLRFGVGDALFIALAIVVVFGVANALETDLAYQSRHLATGLPCSITVAGVSPRERPGDIVVENRIDCGGFFTPVWRPAEFVAPYLACMADVQRPQGVSDEALWYGGLSLWDTTGDECAGYLKHMPRLLAGRVTDLGREVRRDAIQRAAP
jgi:hypothetical protein